MKDLIKEGKNELAIQYNGVAENKGIVGTSMNIGHQTSGENSCITGDIIYYHNEAPPELMDLIMKIYENTNVLLMRGGAL